MPQGIDAATLWGMIHPEPKWAVPGLIPEGVTILAGRPKAKKSWLMLGTALAVACRGVALGSIQVTQGDVLCLALEDSKRRLTQRLRDINPEEAPPAGRLTFYTEWPRLHLGGADLIKQWLGEHPEARLVVIDTLAKVRPPNSKTDNAYTDDYIVGETLTEISKKYGVAIVVVHHVRKMEADDPIDLISGSLGLTGSVDGYIVLRKEPGAADAFLYVNGRDIEEEGNYALEWHNPTCTWHLKEGEARIYKLLPERRRVIDLLTEHGPLGTKEVAELLNPGIEIKDPKTSREYRKVQFLLYRLRDDEYIQVRFYDKRWEVCG
jgi:AAA domain-containing protein